MKVKNLNGTSANKCFCDSWLEHWKLFSKEPKNCCAVKDCSSAPEVGGHVQKDGSSDKDWYIVPLCKACNAKSNQTLEIKDGINLAPANVSKTCGSDTPDITPDMIKNLFR